MEIPRERVKGPMPHSDHIDRWQREREGEPRRTWAGYLAESRRLLNAATKAAAWDQARRDADESGERLFMCEACDLPMGEHDDIAGDPDTGVTHVDCTKAWYHPSRWTGTGCVECGQSRGHHPRCPMLGPDDYYEQDDER